MNEHLCGKTSGSNLDRLRELARMLDDMRYGSIQIHVQDGKIIQIDKIDKIRFS